MTARTNPLRRTPRRPARSLAATSALTLLVAAGCNSSDSPEERQVEAGTYDQKANGDFFFVDTSFGGQAADVRISRQYFGRLVDIVAYDDADGDGLLEDDERITVHRDFVVDPRAESDWSFPYTLETNQVTGAQSLVIEANFADTTGGGRELFRQRLVAAEGGVRPVADNGFVGAGTFTMVPRNAAFVVVFDDLIDAATINQESLRVLVGEPTIIPFEARVLPDANHGDLADFDGQAGLEFYTTRIIIDPAISELESFTTSPPLAVNTIGFPASIDVNFANVEVRMPTRIVPGQQLPVLQNPTAHALTTSSNGTFDFGSATGDLVRAFRSGGSTNVTNDPSNGFLPDETPPTLIGSLSAVITLPPVQVGPDPFVFNLPRIQFSSTTCAQDPEPGDLISQGALFAEVLNSETVTPGGLAENVLVRLIAFPSNFTGPEQFEVSGAGPIQYLVPYIAAEDESRAECFVTVSPPPPDSNFPTVAVAPGATFALRFSEAIDPDRFEPYESFRLLRIDPPTDPNAFISPGSFIPGTVRNTVELQEFRFDPELGLAHEQGSSETYYLDFPDGERAPRDLAGNVVTAVLPTISYTLDPAAPDESTGGRVTRFESTDEEPPFADFTTNPDDVLASLPKPEWFGQIVYDLDAGRIRPRPVVRTQVVCSGSNEIPAAMQVGMGTTLPLSPFGARTQILWRYIDFGESLPLNTDNDIAKDHNYNELNLDVEGVSLSPAGGNPVFESFPEFQMSMSHSLWLPDEVINPLTGALVAPLSGIQGTFDGNLLDAQNDEPQIVHPRELGYTVNPGDQTLASDGTPLIPLPMNQGLPAGQKRFYTWRDTALQARGGPNGFGAPAARVVQITGIGPFDEFIDPMVGPICPLQGAPNPFYLTDEVRTAALPLLVDLRCYPTGGSASSNVFAHQLAHPTTLPGFRAYSAGGRNQAGSLIIVDPDSENIANGGFDPTSMPPGATLPGVDNALYYGGLDLVVRVSRVHSLFFEALDPLGIGAFSAPSFEEPVVFPETQPQGTRIEFDFRGASTIDAIAGEDASRTDAYGDFYGTTKPILYEPNEEDPLIEFRGNASCFDGSFSYEVADENGMTGFLNNDNRWKSDVAELQGARFFQARITFVSNVSTGLTPEIAAVGFSWRE